MSTVAELELPDFDPTDPALRGERFHATMAGLAERSWLARMPLGYVVLDRTAAEVFLRSRDTEFPGMKLAELFGIDDGPLHEEMRRNILHVNGAQHARLRHVVNPSFTPRSVQRHRPAMRRFLEELLEPVAAAGRCDAVQALARPYPALVIATVMGAPLRDAERLAHWSNWIQRQFSAPSLVEQRGEIERAVEEFYAYCGELLARRREEPAEDLLSTLLAAEALDDAERVNLALNVLIGGVDTTQSQLAHALRLFAEHPEQWELLGREPERAARAVEEVLRFEPITPFTARIAIRDMEVRGVRFPEGTVVLVSAFNGNRDADAYEAPSRFDITADRGSAKPLTFGAGIHFCLGANLARAELQEALVVLSARLRDLELDGEPDYGSIDGIYGLEALPVRFRAA